MNRRKFLLTSALAASALPFLPETIGHAESSNAKIKVGCLSWCFHSLAPSVDPEPAVDIIGQLGFDGIELIASSRGDLKTLWTDERVDRIKQKLDRYKMQVSQFVLFQPVVENLCSLNNDDRNRALDYFEAGCRLGAKFNAPMINIVAPWPREYTSPPGYLPRYYDLTDGKPDEKFHIEIDSSFNWDQVWNHFVTTTRDCLERAKAHGLKYSIENHTHTILPDAGSFLRLWDFIKDPALGINLDAGWMQLEREYPPVAIYKLKGHIMNLHIRDIDGLMRTFVAFGHGVMDVRDIVNTLKKTGFDGFASIEQDSHPGDPDMHETCRLYLKTMRELIG
jgi:sugar phosphate isomerase/epimerase